MTAVREPQLTRAFSASPYRANRLDQPRYVPCSGAVACDECAGRQHERGRRQPGPRRAATCKRIMPHAGPALFLCDVDAELWQARDRDDRAAS